MANNRYTFQVLKRLSKRQYYHHKWKPFNINGPNFYGILWELKTVDRKIQSLQSEIHVLKQQLKIAQTYNAPAPLEMASAREFSPRYFALFAHSRYLDCYTIYKIATIYYIILFIQQSSDEPVRTANGGSSGERNTNPTWSAI